MSEVGTGARDSTTGRRQLLLISSRAEPYWRDVPDLLARPNKSGFHFRYETDLVPGELLNEIDALNASDAEGYIVHLDDATAPLQSTSNAGPSLPDTGFPPLEYIPLRHVQNVRVTRFGAYVRVDFVLGNLVDFAGQAAAGTNPYSSRIRDAIIEAGAKTGPRGHYVVSVRHLPLPLVGDEDSTRSLVNWCSVTQQLARFPVFFNSERGTVFLSLRWEGQPTTGGLKWIHEVLGLQDASFRDGRLVLRAGNSYRIHVLQYVPFKDSSGKRVPIERDKFPVGLSLRTDGKIVTATESTLSIRGMYDDGYLMMECAPVPYQAYSYSELRSDSKFFYVAPVRMDSIFVEPTHRVTSLAVVAAALFVAGAFAAPLLALLAHVGLPVSEDWSPWFTGGFDGVAGIVVVFLGASIK